MASSLRTGQPLASSLVSGGGAEHGVRQRMVASARETQFHNEFDQALTDEFFLQAWWRNTDHIYPFLSRTISHHVKSTQASNSAKRHQQQQRLQQQAISDTRQAKARRFDAVMKKSQPMPRNHGVIQLQGCSEAEGAPPSWRNVSEVVIGVYQHARAGSMQHVGLGWWRHTCPAEASVPSGKPPEELSINLRDLDTGDLALEELSVLFFVRLRGQAQRRGEPMWHRLALEALSPLLLPAPNDGGRASELGLLYGKVTMGALLELESIPLFWYRRKTPGDIGEKAMVLFFNLIRRHKDAPAIRPAPVAQLPAVATASVVSSSSSSSSSSASSSPSSSVTSGLMRDLALAKATGPHPPQPTAQRRHHELERPPSAHEAALNEIARAIVSHHIQLMQRRQHHAARRAQRRRRRGTSRGWAGDSSGNDSDVEDATEMVVLVVYLYMNGNSTKVLRKRTARDLRCPFEGCLLQRGNSESDDDIDELRSELVAFNPNDAAADTQLQERKVVLRVAARLRSLLLHLHNEHGEGFAFAYDKNQNENEDEDESENGVMRIYVRRRDHISEVANDKVKRLRPFTFVAASRRAMASSRLDRYMPECKAAPPAPVPVDLTIAETPVVRPRPTSRKSAPAVIAVRRVRQVKATPIAEPHAVPMIIIDDEPEKLVTALAQARAQEEDEEEEEIEQPRRRRRRPPTAQQLDEQTLTEEPRAAAQPSREAERGPQHKRADATTKTKPKRRHPLSKADRRALANAEWYHSATFIRGREEELEYDSEDEVDASWMLPYMKEMLFDFSDLSKQEKEILWLWNAEQLINPVLSKQQAAERLLMLVERNAEYILGQGRRVALLALIRHFRHHRIMTAQDHDQCMRALNAVEEQLLKP